MRAAIAVLVLATLALPAAARAADLADGRAFAGEALDRLLRMDQDGPDEDAPEADGIQDCSLAVPGGARA